MHGHDDIVHPCRTVGDIMAVLAEHGDDDWMCSSSVDFCEEYGFAPGVVSEMLDKAAYDLYNIVTKVL